MTAILGLGLCVRSNPYLYTRHNREVPHKLGPSPLHAAVLKVRLAMGAWIRIGM